MCYYIEMILLNDTDRTFLKRRLDEMLSEEEEEEEEGVQREVEEEEIEDDDDDVYVADQHEMNYVESCITEATALAQHCTDLLERLVQLQRSRNFTEWMLDDDAAEFSMILHLREYRRIIEKQFAQIHQITQWRVMNHCEGHEKEEEKEEKKDEEKDEEEEEDEEEEGR